MIRGTDFETKEKRTDLQTRGGGSKTRVGAHATVHPTRQAAKAAKARGGRRTARVRDQFRSVEWVIISYFERNSQEVIGEELLHVFLVC